MKHKFCILLSYVTIAIAAISMSVPSFAQDVNENTDEELLPVVAYFNMNDTTIYQETRSKYKVINGDTIEVYNYNCTYGFTVIDSTATSYTIKYLPGELSGLDGLENIEAFRSAMNSFMPSEVIFTTDECGSITHILEWEKVGRALTEATNTIFNKLPAETAEKLKSNSLFDFSSEELVMKHFSPANLHFVIHGNAYKMGRTETSSDSNGVKSTIKTIAEYLDKEEATFEGDYRIVNKTISEVTSQQAISALSALLKNTANTPEQWEQIEKELKNIKSIDISQLFLLQYFYNGWPMEIYHSKTTETLGSQIEVVRVECLDANW